MEANPFTPYAFVRNDGRKGHPPVRERLMHVKQKDRRDLDVKGIAKELHRLSFEKDRGRRRDDEARIQNRYARHLMRLGVSSSGVEASVEKFVTDVIRASTHERQYMADPKAYADMVKRAFAGVPSVVRYTLQRMHDFEASKQEGQRQFIGTNDVLDADEERKIDLVEIIDAEDGLPRVDFVQVKKGIITPEEIQKIHDAHATYHHLLLTETELMESEPGETLLEAARTKSDRYEQLCIGLLPTHDNQMPFTSDAEVESIIEDYDVPLTPAEISLVFRSEECLPFLRSVVRTMTSEDDADRSLEQIRTRVSGWATRRDVTAEELKAILPDWKRRATDLIRSGTYRSVIVTAGKVLAVPLGSKA